ncbi:hypothetical protein [Streptomyces sp. AcE210]|uniref:hypothetical protein n=1 Tax=Streptomyces sp. AcE210 TaxID=2292703 RepID=UPI0010591CAE|nr:hypothetical protein [Streptomyces sp. AcE210]
MQGRTAEEPEDCIEGVLSVLVLKWRQDLGQPVKAADAARLEKFLRANEPDNTLQYRVFVTHYKAGSAPIARAVAKGGDEDEAVVRQLGEEIPGLNADCGAAD